LKILIAEDDPNTSRLYSTLLRRSGHQFVLTENGEDCLIIYNNEFRNITDTTDIREHVQPFDAVILCHRIPKMKGLEVAEEIISINPAVNKFDYVVRVNQKYSLAIHLSGNL
jgi:CheY-like chemotaxis protein